jgi:hypothetical protein
METNERTPQWEDLIRNRLSNDDFKSRTCKIFSRTTTNSRNNSDEVCPCGRLVRRHSFDGESLQAKAKREKNSNWKTPSQFKKNQSFIVPVNIFGRLKSNGCKFIRLDAQADVRIAYDLLLADCGGEKHKPALILSVYGGAKYFIMTEKLEKPIIRGIIDAATIAGK